MPDFIPVYSSWVDAIGHDPETNELHVRHVKDGSTTVYSDVPPEIYRAIAQSPSIGSALHGLVRGGQYQFRTIK